MHSEVVFQWALLRPMTNGFNYFLFFFPEFTGIHHEGPIQFISSETPVELNWNFGWLFSWQRHPILYSSYKSQ